MNSIAFLCLATLASTAQLPPIEPPPMPDFQTPVDYLAWYEAQTHVPLGENALDMYGVFLYAPSDSPNAMLAPPADSPAAEQLSALMGRGRPWYGPENRDLAQWTANIDARFRDVFVAGTARPRYAPRPAPGLRLLADHQAPRLHSARAVGQMMFARAWHVSTEEFYTDHFIEAVRTNLALANHLACGVTLEDQLFVQGHRDLVYRQIRHTMRGKIFAAAHLKKIDEVLRNLDTTHLPTYYARSLYFAEARALQLLQHFCTTYGHPGEATLAPQINPKTTNAYYSSRYDNVARRPRGVDSLNGTNPAALAAAIHDYYQRMRVILTSPNVPDLRERLREVHRATMGKHSALSALAMPIDLSVEAAFRTEALRRMAHLFLHTAIKFKETNQWPQQFDELPIADLADYRIDPFTGKDFLQQKRRDRTAIYSVGPNGEDDNADKIKDITYWVVVTKDKLAIDKPKKDKPAQPPATPVENPKADSKPE